MHDLLDCDERACRGADRLRVERLLDVAAHGKSNPKEDSVGCAEWLRRLLRLELLGLTPVVLAKVKGGVILELEAYDSGGGGFHAKIGWLLDLDRGAKTVAFKLLTRLDSTSVT